jgi:hypothetical protein
VKPILLGLFIAVFNFLFQAQDNTFYRKYNFGGMQGALQLATTLQRHRQCNSMAQTLR